MIRRLLLMFVATLVLLFGQNSDAKTDTTKADVIVYGATPGGFCAAIAAAREGATVILIEPKDHVGGLNTGGLSHSDSNQCDRRTVMGLFDEWHTRIEKDYESRGIKLPYKVSVKDHAVWTCEPHVAARVTKQMLDEAKVQVLTQCYLQSVKKNETRITSLVTTGGTFKAKVFVDATYEGDLMAASSVSWTIGREGRAEYGESYAGKQYPKSKMKINGFDSQGKLLPLITTTNAGDEAEGDKNVMVYSFRLCLTEDPKNRVPFPEPAHYVPARFEIMRRYAKAGGRLGFDLYRLPGNKFDGNNSIGGQFSLGLVGGGNGWCDADEAGRAAIWEAHKQYTLELYHFLTTDPAVPEEVRNKYARLGLCKDEFANYGHFSPALYVREGRRMRGIYVLSQKDILEEPEKDDPIVISSFPIDSHDCQRIALKDGHVINEGTIFPVRQKNPKQGYIYHVPYRSILPKPHECTNLLVPVALSCTHVGISSIRVEPTWMILGQSAGVAAALTANDEQERSVQQLPYPKLRERLLAQGQVLELPHRADADTPDQRVDPKGKVANQGKPRLPNIVVILTDDQGYADISLNPHHATEVSTPNMDALAKHGVIFSQAYTSGHVCSPTRAGLMIGGYSQRVGVYTAGDGGRGFDPKRKISPAFLPEEYISAAIGKWHLGLDDDYPDLKWHALNRGFDECYKFMGRGGHSYFDLRSDSTGKFAHPLYRNKRRINDKGYLTNRLSEEAVAFIDRNKVRPFFLYLAYNAVHAPAEAPQADVDAIRRKFPHLSEKRAILMAMLKHLDDGIGDVTAKLKQEGLFDNTLVFFLTDNGGAKGMSANNTPLRGYKSSLDEGGIRTPFVVSWPSQLKGDRTIDVPVISFDILPTVLDATDSLPTENDFDGKSLLPLLTGQTTLHHDTLFWSKGKEDEWAVRRRNWKLHYKQGKTELINLVHDPSEKKNVADSQPERVRELTLAFDAWLKPMADPITGGAKRVDLSPADEAYKSSDERERIRERRRRKRRKRADKTMPNEN